ncbi:MAG: ECF-type sigma factor [Gemmatimonadaceae bacterium]|nr:ECF-type sigma factor [Gemmatimonadaceae bacterium]
MHPTDAAPPPDDAGESPPGSAERIAALFAASERGDPDSANALFVALYDELHRLAERHVARLDGLVTMSATTLVHEVYLDLSSRHEVHFADRARFLAYASRAMRGLAIDHARNRSALKRGGDLRMVTLETTISQLSTGDDSGTIDTEALATALSQLEHLDARLSELVDLHCFGGLSLVEIASIRAVSERTVQRDWRKARMLLRHALST